MRTASQQEKKRNTFTRMSAADFLRLASEADIQKGITDLLRVIGLPFSVTDASLTFDNRGKVAGRQVTTDGWPDVTACLPDGRFCGIETKTETGKLRPAQIKVHAELTAAGALVLVPRSVEQLAGDLWAAGIRHDGLTKFLKGRL